LSDRESRVLLISLLAVLLVISALSWPFGLMGGVGLRPWMVGRGLVARGRFGVPFFWLGGAFRLIVWVLLMALLVLLVRPSARGSAPPVPESALDVLKRRYAAGEITREQYQMMRRELQS
jgi:putative membrane protein